MSPRFEAGLLARSMSRVLARRECQLLLLALVLRVAFVIALPSHEFLPGPDQLLHDSLARGFLAGRGLSISGDILYPPDDQPEWVKKKFEREIPRIVKYYKNKIVW